MCRQRIHRIHYKKKILEPEYLKIFDDDESSGEEIPEEEDEIQLPAIRPRLVERPMLPYIPPPLMMMPIIAGPYILPFLYPFRFGVFRQ